MSKWAIDRTQTGTISSGQSEPGSNFIEGVFHNTRISRAGASPSDWV